MKHYIGQKLYQIKTQFRGLDKGILNSIFILILFGICLTLAASPAVAERNRYDTFHFIYRQFLFLGPAVGTMLGVALLSVKSECSLQHR